MNFQHVLVVVATVWAVLFMEIRAQTKSIIYYGFPSSVKGTIAFRREGVSRIKCASMCISQTICMGWEILEEDGVNVCYVYREIYVVEEDVTAKTYLDLEVATSMVDLDPVCTTVRETETKKSTFHEGLTWCNARGSQLFLPSNDHDIDTMVKALNDLGHTHMWFPITTVEQKGMIWTNYSDVKPTDGVPWKNNEFGYKDPNDVNTTGLCAQIDQNREVIMNACTDMNAGVMCEATIGLG